MKLRLFTRSPRRRGRAGRGVEAEDKLQAVGTHAQWVHAVDHAILPARLPRLLMAASAADQGVAITTTSASFDGFGC
jgi:hypothetical protein